MSLVREALARAEREAAARAAREKGLPPALTDAAQPYRARRRSRAPWLAALAVAALVGAGVAAVLLRAGAARPAEPSPPPAATASGTPPAAAVELPAASAATSAPSPPSAAAPAPAAPASAPAARIVAPIAAPAAPPALAATAELAGSFVREFALGDGRVLRLGGIAWSDAAPLAFLNGRLRGVGEVVEGWRVAAIERDRVVLEAGRLRVALALR